MFPVKAQFSLVCGHLQTVTSKVAEAPRMQAVIIISPEAAVLPVDAQANLVCEQLRKVKNEAGETLRMYALIGGDKCCSRGTKDACTLCFLSKHILALCQPSSQCNICAHISEHLLKVTSVAAEALKMLALVREHILAECASTC